MLWTAEAAPVTVTQKSKVNSWCKHVNAKTMLQHFTGSCDLCCNVAHKNCKALFF